jgi:hypothetical protein
MFTAIPRAADRRAMTTAAGSGGRSPNFPCAIYCCLKVIIASASSPFGLQNFSAELFPERAGRVRIRKAPPKIDFAFSNNCPSMSRLNFSRPVKVHDPAAQFDIQFITSDDKLEDVGILLLVCDRLPVKSLAHIMPAG